MLASLTMDRMVVSANTPVLFSKACELLVMELTLRAWLHTQDDERKTLQCCDIARAIRQDNIHLQFLDEVVPLNGDKEKASRKHPEYVCNGQMQLPLMTMNQASSMPNINGLPQDFIIPPSRSSTEAMFGFGSKEKEAIDFLIVRKITEEDIAKYFAKKAQKKALKVAKKLKSQTVSGYSNDSNPFGDANLNET
ncbi:hypothetical protein RJ639_015727 [Escallonia herrerae]|uniref:Core Histone H2A/H2B/H3 domain-containing protein n=1 Tax=Escallonia herrerae TaxID=1293975 RepID=A0AA89AKX5_9ASTE|nr:hypothetical protein RJ639_015727 [Escallonia herrerae]